MEAANPACHVVRGDRGRGRFTVAARPLVPGEIVLAEHAVACVAAPGRSLCDDCLTSIDRRVDAVLRLHAVNISTVLLPVCTPFNQVIPRSLVYAPGKSQTVQLRGKLNNNATFEMCHTVR